MNRYLMSLCYAFLKFNIIFCIPYIIRQPEAYQHVMKAVDHQLAVSPARLNEALDTQHRIQLNKIISDVYNKRTGHDRILALEAVRRLSFEVPKYEEVDTIFKNIGLHLVILLKRTVRVFDQLLPSVNILHNYFSLLENLTINQTQKTMKQLHDVFRSSLLAMAQEVYAQALREKDDPYRMYELLNIAQALVYRLKETDQNAQVLYNQIDALRPVPFVDELKKLGILATGGL